jgi:FdhD protein
MVRTAVEPSRTVSIERLDGARREPARDHVVVEAALALAARGEVVATIMRTPGHDLELVRGLLHAEAVVAGAITQRGDDRVEVDADPAAFARRGLLSSAACGVCGRAEIADLEQRATEVTCDATIAHEVLVGLPAALRAAQAVFDHTGGLHGAGLFTLAGELVAVREDVGRHNAIDKVVGWALDAGVDPAGHALCLSGRIGYELVQKAIRFGVPIVAAVSAPSSLAIALGERFGVAVCGFVRGERANLYSHGWRVR